VKRYEEHAVRASSLRARIAHAVSCTLKECDLGRDEVAARMSEGLGEDVSKNMLDAYASEAREQSSVPFLRMLALVHVTGDMRLLQMAAELFEHSVVEDRYLPWVEVGQLADKKDNVERAFEAARRNARRGGKS
ncbi:MAG: DNA transposition protein, partial [Rhodospirillales bacterium]|nr:DNA transposition protein [Rhodospirillales bacterium]